MEQLLLDLVPLPPPRRDNYAVGRNAEALTALDGLLRGAVSERQIYLWGAPGTGKTHLLEAAAAEVDGGVYVDCARAGSLPEGVANAPLIALDDVDRLGGSAQQQVFDLHNRVRGTGTALLFAAACPPAALRLRRDVSTRLAWGWVFELHALSDDDALGAFKARASARGIALPDDVVAHVARRFARDMRSLGRVFDAVEQHALRTKRSITLPLLREALERGAPTPSGDSA